jgi:hypothetical protein
MERRKGEEICRNPIELTGQHGADAPTGKKLESKGPAIPPDYEKNRESKKSCKQKWDNNESH